MVEDTSVLGQESQDVYAKVAELEEQLLQSARAGQLLLERNEEAESEAQRLTDLVAVLELKADGLSVELAEAREQDCRETYEDEIRHLNDVIASMEQKNDSLQHDFDSLQHDLYESQRQRDETESRLREELQNLSALHARLETEHAEQAEVHDQECSRLRLQCRSLLEKEERLQALVDEKHRQGLELTQEVSTLKAKLDTNEYSLRQPDCECTGEDDEHPLEAMVFELEAQLTNVRKENHELHSEAEELQLRLEEASQDVEELQEVLANTQGRCRLLELTALEASSLLDDAKCESEARQLKAQKLHELLEESKKRGELEKRRQLDNPPVVQTGRSLSSIRVEKWLGLSKQGLLGLGQLANQAALGAYSSKRCVGDLRTDADMDNVNSSHASSCHSSDAEDDDEIKSSHSDVVSEGPPVASQAKVDTRTEDASKMKASLRLRGGVRRKLPCAPEDEGSA